MCLDIDLHLADGGMHQTLKSPWVAEGITVSEESVLTADRGVRARERFIPGSCLASGENGARDRAGILLVKKTQKLQGEQGENE